MIRKVVVRRFKGFEEVTFDLPGNVVLVGPNNSGKTTLLQAIAAWDVALRGWQEQHGDEIDARLGDPKLAKSEYPKVPLARQAFVPVPLRSFYMLWHETIYTEPIEICVQGEGWSVTMEFLPDTTEQIYFRPSKQTRIKDLEQSRAPTVFVPPMSGVLLEEPLYSNQLTLDVMVARLRPGDVLRNLLHQASTIGEAWREVSESAQRLFGIGILPPVVSGAFIRADYRIKGGPLLDLISSGSGFQQVLMLLCFMHTRPGAILLLDEPDAHLHVILQDAVYGELKRVAAEKNSQLVIATHSEVIVNAAELDEIRVAFDPGKELTDPKKKQSLRKALRWVTHIEIAQARTAPGILYLEDYTDLEILRAWARVLQHRSLPLLTKDLFWRKATVESPSGQEGISAREHYEALTLVRELPGLVLVDGDAKETIKSTPITGKGLQRLRWKRYEIESYLVNAATLARFVESQIGSESAKAPLLALEEFLSQLPRGKLLEDYLQVTKAREKILPPALDAADLPGFPYTRYHEIAAAMTPEEIHPEVVEKLDALCKAFGR